MGSSLIGPNRSQSSIRGTRSTGSRIHASTRRGGSHSSASRFWSPTATSSRATTPMPGRSSRSTSARRAFHSIDRRRREADDPSRRRPTERRRGRLRIHRASRSLADALGDWSMAHRLEVVLERVVRDVRAEQLARHVRAAVVEASPDACLDELGEWLRERVERAHHGPQREQERGGARDRRSCLARRRRTAAARRRLRRRGSYAPRPTRDTAR